MLDAELVQRARRGDLSALERLFERHQATAFTAALRLLGQAADAEDVLQDALVRAYTNLGDLSEASSFGGWLRRIAVHLSLNVLRRRGQIRFDSLDALSNEANVQFEDDRELTPDTALARAGARSDLQELLARLSPEQRVAVVLRDMYDYDIREIATIQRCGISATKMRIVRGRNHLREMIEKAHV